MFTASSWASAVVVDDDSNAEARLENRCHNFAIHGINGYAWRRGLEVHHSRAHSHVIRSRLSSHLITENSRNRFSQHFPIYKATRRESLANPLISTIHHEQSTVPICTVALSLATRTNPAYAFHDSGIPTSPLNPMTKPQLATSTMLPLNKSPEDVNEQPSSSPPKTHSPPSAPADAGTPRHAASGSGTPCCTRPAPSGGRANTPEHASGGSATLPRPRRS